MADMNRPPDDLGVQIYEIAGTLLEGEEASSAPDSVQSTVTRLIEEAIAFYEENLEPDQVQATDYYYVRPFGDEKEGRSQVISSEVRDAVLFQTASLMRMFMGPEALVEFKPDGPEDVPTAELQTQYVNYILMEDNPGYVVLDSAIKDALIRRIGIFKWGWTEDEEQRGTELTGLTEQQVQILEMDEEVESYEIVDVQEAAPGVTLYDCEVVWTRGGYVKVEAVPNEEFIFTPDAKDLDSAGLVAHVREVPADELIGMGVDPALVDKYKGAHLTNFGEDNLRGARQFHGGVVSPHVQREAESRDDARAPVVYAEAYARVRINEEDGTTQLRKFECIGPGFRIINGDDEGPGELVDMVPFAVITPVLEPHTIVGLSDYDLLADIQRINSQIERGMLNSLAKAVDPPLEVVFTEVNMRDVLNPEISGVIRVRRPGMVREVVQEFIGPEALSVLEYYRDKRGDRIGMTRASEGLDPDSLQSSTKEAVGATLSRSQQMLDMIARNFAETGLKRLYLGILKELVEHQDFARTVQIQGQWIDVDPRSWRVDRDVTVGPAIGSGSPAEKLALLERIAAKQSELQQMGSPLVTTVEVRNTLRRYIEMAGWRDNGEFFRPWGPEQEAELQQRMAQQPPPPNLEEQLIQVEMAKVEARSAMDRAKIELDRWRAMIDDDRERDRTAREMALREREIEAKHAVDIRDAELSAQVARDRAAMDADVKLLTAQQSPPQGSES